MMFLACEFASPEVCQVEAIRAERMDEHPYPQLSRTPVPALQAEPTCTVRAEEPTGLYRRTGEILEVPLDNVGGSPSGFKVADPEGRELPWQVAGGRLHFPVPW